MSASFDGGKSAAGQTKTVSVTSGKGGVGKSTLVANMALSLSQQGKKILILDGDLGMANIDIMYGIRTSGSVEQVLSGQRSLEDIMVEVSPNVTLIPGGSGVYGLQNTTTLQRKMLLDQVNSLDRHFDLMFIDTASGIDDNVLSLNSAAQEILVVLNPDPSSLTDAYALIKVMHKKFNETRFSVVSNLVTDEREGLQSFKRLSDVAQKFLNVSLDYKGFIPADGDLRKATKSQQLVVRELPRSASSLAIKMLSEKLSGSDAFANPKGGMQFFWEQLVSAAS